MVVGGGAWWVVVGGWWWRDAPGGHGRPQRPVPAHRFWPGGGDLFLLKNAARTRKATPVWGIRFIFAQYISKLLELRLVKC